MAERTGKVVEVVLPEEGSRAPIKIDVLLDGKDKPNKVTAWRTIKQGEDDVENNAAKVKVGDYGTFTGETKEETFNNNTFTRFYADSFVPKIQTPNGNHVTENSNNVTSSGSSSGNYSATDNRNPSFALAYAKDIVCHLIDIGAAKDETALEGLWLGLAEAGNVWLSQNQK